MALFELRWGGWRKSGSQKLHKNAKELSQEIYKSEEKRRDYICPAIAASTERHTRRNQTKQVSNNNNDNNSTDSNSVTHNSYSQVCHAK